MKNIIIIIAFFTFVLSSCQENERMVYNEKAGLYIEMPDKGDSVVFSFTMSKYEEDTLKLVVNLLGKTTSYDRPFKIKLNDGTTAVEGTHFEKLEDHYILSKNSAKITIPIYINKTDDLDEVIESIDISIVEDDTFSIGYKDKNRMRYFITNKLVRPYYWDDLLVDYFDEYSEVKHQICIDLMGHDFPLTEDEIYDKELFSYYMKMGRKAAMYFALNEVRDENNKLINTWDPY